MNRIRRSLQRLKNTPGLRGDVAAIVLLAVGAMVCAGYIFSQYAFESPLKDRYVFAAEFEKAPGVRPESRQEVRIAGVTVGKITEAEVLPNGNARLEMSIDPKYKVYSNARVLLRTKAPLNIMYVALDPGGPPGEELPENSVLPPGQTERPIQPFEALEKLDERTQVAVTSLLNELDAALVSAPQHLPVGLAHTKTAMVAFQPVLEQLATRRENIEQLVTSLAHIATAVGDDDRRLARLTAALQTTLGTIAQRDSELGAALDQIPAFSRDLRAALGGVRGLTNELDPTLEALESASGRLPDAVERLLDTVGAVDGAVDAARPVVKKAKPVVADLRPFVGDLDGALADLRPVADHLPSATKAIVPWLEDLSAFVYQTSSAFSLGDANGGYGRALLTLDVTNPTGGLAPMPDDSEAAND